MRLVCLVGIGCCGGVVGLDFGHKVDVFHALKKSGIGDAGLHEVIEYRIDGGLLGRVRHELI